MKTLHVSPSPEINGNDGADIKHDESTAVEVTATEPNTGASTTFWVQPGQTTNWKPPAGWDDVHFTADGFDQVSRSITWTVPPVGGG